MLCWFPPYNSADQSQLYLHLLRPWPPCTPPFYPCSHQSATLGSLSCTTTAHQLHSTPDSARMLTLLSPFSLPHCVYKSIFHISVSISSLHIAHQKHFSRFHTYIYIFINILYLFFCLTLLCIIGPGFIHLTRTDWNSFSLMAGKYSIIYMYNCYIALFSYNLNFTESSVKAQNLLRINTKKKKT